MCTAGLYSSSPAKGERQQVGARGIPCGRASVLAVRVTVWGWCCRWALDGVTAGAGGGHGQLQAEPATCEAAWAPNCMHMHNHAILLPCVRLSPVSSTGAARANFPSMVRAETQYRNQCRVGR